jgi:lipopolysaccharide biosynthesis glycosyltransferase
MATMMYSAIANLHPGSRLSFHVIDGGLTAADREMIQDVVGRDDRGHALRWYRPDACRVPDAPVGSAYSRETNLRLLAPELLPTEVVRLAWLDCDMVVEADLSALWTTDLGSNSLGAVADFGASCFGDIPGIASTCQQIGVDKSTPYFNAGVLLIDLARWRSESVAARAIVYLDTFHDRAKYSDQDALNAIIAGQWLALDRRWNAQMSAMRYFSRLSPERRPAWYVQMRDDLALRPFIIHYTDSKPWQSALLSRFRSRYYYYLHHSGVLSAADYFYYRVQTALQSVNALFSHGLRRFCSQ